jgi:GTPase SAR1 family protein
MIARLQTPVRHTTPVFDITEFRTESDVEQKLIYPFLTHASYLNLPSAWVRTKEYMTPTEIDKAAGRRFGYFPDYSVWISGLPLVIIEAKMPDVAIEAALREARLYAVEINKRYPPNVNPIGFILACNGEQLALTQWDSESSTLASPCVNAMPGSAVLNALQGAIGRAALEETAKKLAAHFQSRPFHSVAAFMGGQVRLNQQLGVNEFAEPLFPTLTKYFGSTSEETPDDVIDRAYVTSDELGRYEGVLETYLKDRTSQIAGTQLKTIETSRHQATGISTEVQKFATNPTFYSRVQLIVGAVGAGKSTFIRRYYRRLMSNHVRERTRWAFLNFNALPPSEDMQNWVASQFISSFREVNGIDLHEFDHIEKIFGHELNRFDRGPNKRLKTMDPVEFERRRASYLDDLTKNPTEFAKCVARHFSGEMGLGIVVVFDNVDKRSRDLQLAIFEAAQWFKDLTRALVLINLRDSTFEAHRDEPPLDAFANAINFYVQPPRFAQVIRKRLELVLEVLPSEVAPQQEYALSSGYRIRYPASRLGEFLMTIYLSLFDQRTLKVASALEALVAKNVRRALGMFADILVSPHIPTNLITGAILTGGASRIQEFRIIRSLMRQRYKFYNGKSSYIRNVMDVDLDHNQPSNFLYADILEYLIRNRKARIDFVQEGYATVRTLKKKMSAAGYDEEDVFSAIETLVQWGLIEPESLIVEGLTDDDAVRMHATGFIHMRFFLDRLEYLVGITTDMRFASRDVAEEIGNIWAGHNHLPDLSRAAKAKVLKRLKTYIEQEYFRRCKRHAFYEEFGLGGRVLVSALERAWDHLHSDRSPGDARADPHSMRTAPK